MVASFPLPVFRMPERRKATSEHLDSGVGISIWLRIDYRALPDQADNLTSVLFSTTHFTVKRLVGGLTAGLAILSTGFASIRTIGQITSRLPTATIFGPQSHPLSVTMGY